MCDDFYSVTRYMSEDIDLLQTKILEGSEKAFNELFHRCYAYLCAVAYQYVSDKQISEELSEDVLFTLWNKRNDILPVRSVKSYLFVSTRNRSIDYLRNHPQRQFTPIDENACFVPDEELFEKYIFSELEKKIEEEIKTLPDDCRRVFCLSRYENKNYQEIADELGISVSTVKYHISHALSILRTNLAPYLTTILAFYLESKH